MQEKFPDIFFYFISLFTCSSKRKLKNSSSENMQSFVMLI